MERKPDIIFSSDLYDESAVRESLSDFSALLTGEVSRQGRTIRVIITQAKSDREEIINEFCNYVLATMKNRAVV